MAPDVIADRYRVLRAVGRGGMGDVWLCRDERLGRDVAIKQVGLLPGEEKADVDRALREARTLAVLNHRNVVAVYDTVDEQDRFWLVMEYVPGRTLSEMIAQDGPLAAVRAARIGAQVADGLAVAHARGIVHRDVKPGNVLVTDDDLAKVSDFGIARTSGGAQLTRAGIISGTPAYFAPEVARGDDPGPAADVWALGATLYAAVEGRPPYEDKGNPLALLAFIASGARPHPEHAGILREALDRMFDPDPRSRWSMADAAHVLHRLYKRHGPAPTRSITHPIEQPAEAAAPALVPHSFSEPSQEESERPQEPADESPAEPAAAEPAEPAAAEPAVPPAEEPAEPPAEEPLPPPPSVDQESAPPARKRRVSPFLVAALVLLLVIGGLGAYLLFGSNDNESPTSAGSEVSDSSEPDPEPETSPNEEPAPAESSAPEETPTEEPTSSESPSETSSPSAAGSAEEFASTYYGYLPDDTSTGWRSLAPSLRRSIGRGSYDGFWSTISAVEVNGVEEVEPEVVDVSLVYTNNDGTAEDEVHRLYLEPAGDGYLIVDDEVVG